VGAHTLRKEAHILAAPFRSRTVPLLRCSPSDATPAGGSHFLSAQKRYGIVLMFDKTDFRR